MDAAVGARDVGPGCAADWPVDRRALCLWPRLSRRALRRCDHDPHRIANLVSHRTTLSEETILLLLTVPNVSDDEAATWFG
jgi:hypothetical protein